MAICRRIWLKPWNLAGALVVALAAAIPLAAHAAEFARTEILGFSKDGSRFAFEEFGIQDGSGFPYSSIYVIDTDTDSWLPGSPFRRIDEVDDSQPLDFDAELERTRARNRAEAQPLLDEAGIAGRGATLAHNPATERLVDPFRMEAMPLPAAPKIGEPIILELAEYPLEAGTFCPSGMGQTQGFRLTLAHEGNTRVLNDDTSLPKSRGCPLRYRIERLVVHRESDRAPAHFAVIVLMEVIGFEGAGGRYLAITGKL